MSMIIICQSNKDLKQYGLKCVYEVGLTYAQKYINEFGFSGSIWSSSTFCILYDESYNKMRPYNQNIQYKSTPIYVFLEDLLTLCEKIAIFHCEPLPNKYDWCFFDNRKSFHEAMEKALCEGDISKAYNLTYVFEKCV